MNMTVLKARILMRLSLRNDFVSDYTIATVKEALRIEGTKLICDPLMTKWLNKHLNAIKAWKEKQNG